MKQTKKTLEEIANEYVSQDNYATRFPIAWLIREEKLTPVDYWGLGYDYLKFESTYYDDIILESIKDASVLSLAKQYCDDEDEDEIDAEFSLIEDPDVLEAFIQEWIDPEAELIPMISEEFESFNQMFLSESSTNKHIELNKHNLSMPRPYCLHVYDNEDMVLLIKELMKKATLPIEEWNHEAKRYFIEDVLEVKK